MHEDIGLYSSHLPVSPRQIYGDSLCLISYVMNMVPLMYQIPIGLPHGLLRVYSHPLNVF